MPTSQDLMGQLGLKTIVVSVEHTIIGFVGTPSWQKKRTHTQTRLINSLEKKTKDEDDGEDVHPAHAITIMVNIVFTALVSWFCTWWLVLCETRASSFRSLVLSTPST